MGADLGLSQSLTWVVDAYALTLASHLLVAGALGDRFGRRGALLASVALFGVFRGPDNAEAELDPGFEPDPGHEAVPGLEAA